MPELRSSHDMALWLLIMKRGFFAYGLDENLARYRCVGTSNTSSKTKAIRDVWKVYRQTEKLTFMYSVWCFNEYIFNAIKEESNMKRLVDIFSLFGIVILLPLFLLLSILIKSTSKGPVFFVQTRVGQAGKLFKMIKFRTMYEFTGSNNMITFKGRPRSNQVRSSFKEVQIG